MNAINVSWHVKEARLHNWNALYCRKQGANGQAKEGFWKARQHVRLAREIRSMLLSF